jgi:hypothetical protein
MFMCWPLRGSFLLSSMDVAEPGQIPPGEIDPGPLGLSRCR